MTSTHPDPDVGLHAPESALIRPGDVVAVVNQKGGAGKTTTATTIGAYLAAEGVPVTLIDADEQDGSVTEWLPPQWDDVPLEEQYDLQHVLQDEVGLDQALWPTTIKGLSIVPSFTGLTQFDTTSEVAGKDSILQFAVDESQRKGTVTIIDCPPSLRQTTVTALVAASAILIPAKPGGLDFKGMASLNRTLGGVRRRLRRDQRTAAVVTTMVNTNARLTDMVVSQLREDYPEALHASVGNTTKVGESQFAQEPLHVYEPRGTVTRQYKEITEALFAPILEEVRGGQ